jgi:SAM-dependent methyltransferase
MDRFLLTHLDLREIERNPEIRKSDFHMKPEGSKRVRYPVRAIRYWWISQLLCSLDLSPDATIVDIGAERGNMRRYLSGCVSSSGAAYSFDRQAWIAVDQNVDDGLHVAGYSRAVRSDVNQPLPFDHAVADVVICIHVMEHVFRPEYTMSEIARILKPGGWLFAGSPVAPMPVSLIQQRALRRRLRRKSTGPNGHVNSFSPGDWKRLFRDARLDLELMCGTHLMRASGSAVENSLVWAKMNLWWGALFPSLGSELCLVGRKPQ